MELGQEKGNTKVKGQGCSSSSGPRWYIQKPLVPDVGFSVCPIGFCLVSAFLSSRTLIWVSEETSDFEQDWNVGIWWCLMLDWMCFVIQDGHGWDVTSFVRTQTDEYPPPKFSCIFISQKLAGTANATGPVSLLWDPLRRSELGRFSSVNCFYISKEGS